MYNIYTTRILWFLNRAGIGLNLVSKLPQQNVPNGFKVQNSVYRVSYERFH